MRSLDLRLKLDGICSGINAIEQLRLIEVLRESCYHKIVGLDSAVNLSSYTCVMFAFNFICKAQYAQVALRYPEVFAGKDFMNWMLDNQLLEEKSLDSLSEGDYVIYLDNEESFKHIGIWIADGVIHSKWGTLGLYEHPLFEVPTQYGDNLIYCKKISEDFALNHFFKYAQSLGVLL